MGQSLWKRPESASLTKTFAGGLGAQEPATEGWEVRRCPAMWEDRGVSGQSAGQRCRGGQV